MTDKQIMIDKVDVSECFWLWVNTDKNYKSRCIMNKDVYSQCTYCKDYPNCLFKQLARKTQECEELKEKNQKLEMQLCNDCGERDDYNIPCKMIRDLDYGLQKEIEENDRYRKALEEIEQELKEDIYCESQECGCDDFEECLNCVKTQILDIINKAKGEGND